MGRDSHRGDPRPWGTTSPQVRLAVPLYVRAAPRITAAAGRLAPCSCAETTRGARWRSASSPTPGCRDRSRGPGGTSGSRRRSRCEQVVLGAAAARHRLGAVRPASRGSTRDTGLPRSFLELSVAGAPSIWRDGTRAPAEPAPDAALVVSMHGRSLSELRRRRARRGARELRAHVERERARQELCAAAGDRRGAGAAHRRQMWTWDGLSLALCLGWRAVRRQRRSRPRQGCVDVELREREDGTIALEPWPLAASAWRSAARAGGSLRATRTRRRCSAAFERGRAGDARVRAGGPLGRRSRRARSCECTNERPNRWPFGRCARPAASRTIPLAWRR